MLLEKSLSSGHQWKGALRGQQALLRISLKVKMQPDSTNGLKRPHIHNSYKIIKIHFQNLPVCFAVPYDHFCTIIYNITIMGRIWEGFYRWFLNKTKTTDLFLHLEHYITIVSPQCLWLYYITIKCLLFMCSVIFYWSFICVWILPC